jgi:hypothetical protein
MVVIVSTDLHLKVAPMAVVVYAIRNKFFPQDFASIVRLVVILLATIPETPPANA